jgi:hypothetical protein
VSVCPPPGGCLDPEAAASWLEVLAPCRDEGWCGEIEFSVGDGGDVGINLLGVGEALPDEAVSDLSHVCDLKCSDNGQGDREVGVCTDLREPGLPE